MTNMTRNDEPLCTYGGLKDGCPEYWFCAMPKSWHTPWRAESWRAHVFCPPTQGVREDLKCSTCGETTPHEPHTSQEREPRRWTLHYHDRDDDDIRWWCSADPKCYDTATESVSVIELTPAVEAALVSKEQLNMLVDSICPKHRPSQGDVPIGRLRCGYCFDDLKAKASADAAEVAQLRPFEEAVKRAERDLQAWLDTCDSYDEATVKMVVASIKRALRGGGREK